MRTRPCSSEFSLDVGHASANNSRDARVVWQCARLFVCFVCGALKAKKKSELQDIALGLGIGANGTKDELEHRIRRVVARACWAPRLTSQQGAPRRQ